METRVVEDHEATFGVVRDGAERLVQFVGQTAGHLAEGVDAGHMAELFHQVPVAFLRLDALAGLPADLLVGPLELLRPFPDPGLQLIASGL